jgi:hypothetical protein
MTHIKPLWPFSVQIPPPPRKWRTKPEVSRLLIPNFMTNITPPPFRTGSCVVNSEDSRKKGLKIRHFAVVASLCDTNGRRRLQCAYECFISPLVAICSSALARDGHAWIHSGTANFWGAKRRYLIRTRGHRSFEKSYTWLLRPMDTRGLLFIALFTEFKKRLIW